MPDYELLYIVDPRLPEDELAALQERLNNAITAGNGEVVSTDTMGVRRLAYPIKKLDEGRYLLINFKSESALAQSLNAQLRLLQQVVRFMIVNKEE